MMGRGRGHSVCVGGGGAYNVQHLVDEQDFSQGIANKYCIKISATCFQPSQTTS